MNQRLLFAHAARMLAPLAFALHIESLPFSCIPTKVPFSVPGQCDQFSHLFNVRRVFFEKTIPPRVLDWPGGDPEAFAEMQAAYQILCSASWTATLLLCHFLWRSNRRYDLFLWILSTSLDSRNVTVKADFPKLGPQDVHQPR